MAGRNSGGNSVTSSYPSATEYKTTVNVVERVWNVPTDSVPKAGLVIIHGGCWHTGWFGELGDLLSSPDHCIRVSGPDLVAHGMSDDVFPGYRNYCESFDELANEARAAVVRARAALPDGTPIFLLGESMGGLVCLLHLVTHNVDVDGLILCGGLLEIAPALLPPRAVIPVLKAVSYLWPSLAVPGAAIGGESFEGAFGDPAVGPVARADPLVTEMEPPRLGFMTGVMNTMDLVKKESAEKVKVKSVLMMHYEGDQRTLYKSCKALVENIPTEDKVFITLEGTHHQIFQDTPDKSKKHGEMVARFIAERTT